jgi:hypothetical protein
VFVTFLIIAFSIMCTRKGTLRLMVYLMLDCICHKGSGTFWRKKKDWSHSTIIFLFMSYYNLNPILLADTIFDTIFICRSILFYIDCLNIEDMICK